MQPQDLLSTIKLYWPFASRTFSNTAVNFDYYAKGFLDGFSLSKNNHEKNINDRELRIAQLLATIEELKSEDN